jgi:hypothetical protein
MVKYATALRLGTAEAEQVLRRSGAARPCMPVAAPGAHGESGARSGPALAQDEELQEAAVP